MLTLGPELGHISAFASFQSVSSPWPWALFAPFRQIDGIRQKPRRSKERNEQMQAKVRVGETEITSDVCAHSRVQLAKDGQEGLKFFRQEWTDPFFPEGQVNNIYQGWTPRPVETPPVGKKGYPVRPCPPGPIKHPPLVNAMNFGNALTKWLKISFLISKINTNQVHFYQNRFLDLCQNVKHPMWNLSDIVH